VEKGVRGAVARGVFAGYPVVDVAVALTDGQAHAKDSHAADFEIAGSLAFQEACRKAGLVLLEPVCAVEVTAPESHTGDVLGDLASRRGVVDRIAVRGNAAVVTAHLPVGATFDYVARLRGLTHGRGSASMKPDGYAVAPEKVVKEAVK
jgi:elongation factor G